MHILWLGDPACHNPALVGGKAASLSRLAARYSVPPGFCLTTTAFEYARREGMALDRAADPSLCSWVLPPTLYGQLSDAYREMAARCGSDEPSVAVRSSAVDEDSDADAFAGQHDTYLNVVGVEAVADAVVRCWASAHSPRALEYRRRRSLSTEDIRIAVLVQQLVTADVFAVLFSANPITGSRDEVVVNASWGLGESIVGGTVTPDTYIIHKSNLSIVSSQIAEKESMTVLAPCGTQEVEVPPHLRTRPALDDGQIKQMAQLAVDLEAEMGQPVDIECAYQVGQLYLLQCRPITTLR